MEHRSEGCVPAHASAASQHRRNASKCMSAWRFAVPPLISARPLIRSRSAMFFHPPRLVWFFAFSTSWIRLRWSRLTTNNRLIKAMASRFRNGWHLKQWQGEDHWERVIRECWFDYRWKWMIGEYFFDQTNIAENEWSENSDLFRQIIEQWKYSLYQIFSI